MTYLVEINDNTNTGKKALSYLQKLQLKEPSIRITHKKSALKKLSPEEMVLPGGPSITSRQLDEFLDRADEGKEISLSDVRKKLEKRFKKPSK
jgi:2-succinyl-5-enolpyruvyl-6-hydroxy-3-cyclohexene-1-carboxylate synthase